MFAGFLDTLFAYENDFEIDFSCSLICVKLLANELKEASSFAEPSKQICSKL